MGRSVNKVQIIGNLCRDPEMKYLPSGSAVVTISVATDESYMDKNSGQKVEKTEFHRLTAFGKVAEIIGQYLKKGSKAYFEGKLRTNEYEKDGVKRYSTEIVVNDMMMLDSSPNAGQQPQPGYQQPAPQQQGNNQSQGGFAPQQPAFNQQPQQPAQRPNQQPQSYAQQSGGAPQQQAPAQQPQQGSNQAPHSNSFDDFNDAIPF